MDAQQHLGTGAWHAQGEAAIRASGIDISKAITQSGPNFFLGIPEIEHIRKTYDLDRWQSKIGISIDGAEAKSFAKKYGIDLLQQLSERPAADAKTAGSVRK